MIRSKFSGDTIFWSIFAIIPLFLFVVFTYRVLYNFIFCISDILVLSLFIFIFFILVNFLKHIKYIIINGNKLKYFSVLVPFGKELDLGNYVGKIVLEETGTRGSYKVIYLIDERNVTRFKIMGLHYKNFEELNKGTGLKVIRFTPSMSQYFKLLFFEKLMIKDEINSNKEYTNVALAMIKTVAIIGIILAVFMSIIRAVGSVSGSG